MLLLLGVAVMALLATPKQSVAAAPTKSCSVPSNTALVNPFTAWGDLADYFLIPGGSLESTRHGWTLKNATVEAGNEPFYVGSDTDAKSLKLNQGGSAVSPSFCVGAEHPTFRLFAHQTNVGASAPTGNDVNVFIRYTNRYGVIVDQKVERLVGLDYANWAPSPAVNLYQKLDLAPGATTTARVVIKVEDVAGGAWRLDDVYVDPYRRA